MSTIELKNKLKDKIDSLNEDHLLEHLLEIIEFETSDKIFEIPEEHKANIEVGLAQIKAGRTITNEEVQRKIKEWLDK